MHKSLLAFVAEKLYFTSSLYSPAASNTCKNPFKNFCRLRDRGGGRRQQGGGLTHGWGRGRTEKKHFCLLARLRPPKSPLCRSVGRSVPLHNKPPIFRACCKQGGGKSRAAKLMSGLLGYGKGFQQKKRENIHASTIYPMKSTHVTFLLFLHLSNHSTCFDHKSEQERKQNEATILLSPYLPPLCVYQCAPSAPANGRWDERT